MGEHYRPLRVLGHGLLHEGRPVLDQECCGLAGRTHGDRNHYDQHGHGHCSCGAMSDHEITTAARQRWHREHKAAVANGE